MEMMPGYKQTEVGVIPAEWQTLSLENLSSFITKGSTPTTYGFKWESSGILFLRSECVSENGLDLNQSMYISPEAHAALRRSEVCDGDILITITGNVGRIVILTKGFGIANLNQHIARIRLISQHATEKYVYYFLSKLSVRRHFNSITTGQAYPQISLQQVRDAKIALPPLPEQRAIAAALSDVDALLAKLDQIIAKKRDIKQAAMQQLLTGKKRLPGFNGEWVIKRLGDVAFIERGASPRPIDSPVWFDDNSTVGWVRISDVTKAGMYLRETNQRLSTLGIRNSRPVGRGGLIMSICATVGRPVITEIDTCIHDGFVVFNNLQANKQFLYYVLKSIESAWAKHGQTGSQMNLNTELIKKTKIVLPTLSEQTAIAAVLFDMDAEIDELKTRRDKSRALKQGMMQELLTGRIRLV